MHYQDVDAFIGALELSASRWLDKIIGNTLVF
jgi:hypothetical protein